MATKKKTDQKATPFRTVIQNLPFHNFEEEKQLVALFKDTTILGDEEKLDKDGNPTTFTANVMVDLKTGEEVYVQNSYCIEKAIRTAKKEFKDEIREVVFEIEFLGKTTVKGKPFNQFKIGYCTLAAYEGFIGE